MSWDSFVWFALAASVFWICGAVVSLKAESRLSVVESPRSGRSILAAVLTGCGSVIFISFIVGVWITLGRPPLRTMGETRLWFSLFLSLIGLGVYLRWRYRWVLPFAALMSVVFACINIFKPEIHTEELMPALRSPWFVPHVIVYMFAYAVLGVATILAVRLLWLSRTPVAVVRRLVSIVEPHQPSKYPATVVRQAHQPIAELVVTEPNTSVTEPVEVTSAPDSRSPRRLKNSVERSLSLSKRPVDDLRFCDTLVRIGWGFLTMGMVMGSLWAKQAWGDFWTWDPKETWAAATWLSYLLYLHLRQGQVSFSPSSGGSSSNGSTLSASRGLRLSLLLLLFSFLLLQMCWWGVNYLPSAQGFSLHTY